MCNMCPMGPGVNVWFTCKPCRNYFVKVHDFIQHKQKFHSQDFHQFITFEEATDWDPNLSSFSTLPMNEDDPDLTCGSTTRAHDLYLDSLGLLFWFACKLCDSFFLNADDLVEHVKKTHNTFNENQKKTGFIILEERTDTHQNNNWFSLASPKETIDNYTQDNFLISQPSVLPSSENINCNLSLSIKSSSIISNDIINLNTPSTTPCHETLTENFYLPSLVQFDDHPQPNDNNLLIVHSVPGSTLLHFPGVGAGNSDSHKPPPAPSTTKSQHTEAVKTTEKISGISTTQFSSGSGSDLLRTRLTLEQTQIHLTNNPNSNQSIAKFVPKPKQQNEFQEQVKVQQETNKNNKSSKIFKCLHTMQFQIPNNVHSQAQDRNESAIHLEIGTHTLSKSGSNSSENDSDGKFPYGHLDCYMGADAEPLPVPVPVSILSESVQSVTTEIESTVDPLLERQPNQVMPINNGQIQIQLLTTQNTIPEFPELPKQQQGSDQPVGHATTLLPAQTNNVILNRARGHQRKCRKRNKPSKHEIRSGDTSSSDLNHNYYKCRYPTCKKRFKTNLALQNHAFYHTVDPHRIFPCPRQNCNLTFKSETDLFDHLPVHTPEVKYFFCLHHNCGKSFRYNYQLKEHFKNNHYWSPTQTAGPFRCPRPALQHCRDLLFKTQWHLKVHLENSSVHNNSSNNKKPAAGLDQNQNQLKITDKSKPTTADSRSILNLGSIITIPKSELSAVVAVSVSEVDGSETEISDITDLTDSDPDLQRKQPEKIEDTCSSSNSIIH